MSYTLFWFHIKLISMTSHSFQQKNHFVAFVILSVLFFMWGLITVMTGFVVPELMNVFGLSYYEKIFIGGSFFGTYLLVGYPAGKFIDHLGFKNGIVGGVIIAATGSLLFYIAALEVSYSLCLLSLFILATGITVLQVGANSYTILIGMRGKGAQKLTLVQAFNSMGAFVATFLAAYIIGTDGSIMEDISGLDPQSIRWAYVKMVEFPFVTFGIILILLAIVILLARLPKVSTAGVEPLIEEKNPPRKYVLQFPHVLWGGLAIFLYVGAEVTIFQFLLSRKAIALNQEAYSLVEELDLMIKIFFLGLMLGRFAGAYGLSFISPRRMMILFSLGATSIVLMFIAIVPLDETQDWQSAMWIIAASGLFNSVLFPCIFTMAMDGLGKFSEEASSVLVMAIGGGAIVPFIIFSLISSDPGSIKVAFAIILASYFFILLFGFKWSRYKKRTNFY
jgi:FHS family L-fucose permease-like MFS transporter